MIIVPTSSPTVDVNTDLSVRTYSKFFQANNIKDVWIDYCYLYYAAPTDNVIYRENTCSTGGLEVAGASGVANSVDGMGSMVNFNGPSYIAGYADAGSESVYLYISDMNNHNIRKVLANYYEVTTVSGSGSAGNVDGLVGTAAFNNPMGLCLNPEVIPPKGSSKSAVSANYYLYVADQANHKIRQINLNQQETVTLVGTGANSDIDGGTSVATLNNPTDLAMADGYNMYVTTYYSVRRVDLDTQQVTSIVGIVGTHSLVDGALTAASFSGALQGLIFGSGSHSLFVTDAYSIRYIDMASQVATTVAGGAVQGTLDGLGTNAGFYNPYGIAYHTPSSSFYVADYLNNQIRVLENAPTSSPTTAAPVHPTVSPTTGSPSTWAPTKSGSPTTVTPTTSPTTYAPTATGYPVPVSATINDALSSVIVTFSLETTAAAFASCSAVLASVSSLGSSPACVWANALQLEVQFGTSPTIAVGETLTITAGAVLSSSTQESSATNKDIVVSAPANPPTVQVLLSGPDSISDCYPITLTSTVTGSGGRDAAYTWTYYSGDAAVATYVATMGSVLSVTFSSGYIPAGTHKFGMTATNWLGSVGSANYTITVSSGIVPQLLVSEPVSFSRRRSETMSIQVRIELQTCDNVNVTADSTTVAWAQATDAGQLSTTAQDELASSGATLTTTAVVTSGSNSSVLYVAPNVLEMGATYGFIFNGTLFQGGTVLGSVSSSFLITVQTEGVVATISGGASRDVSTVSSSTVTVDASTSYDPANLTTPPKYSWSLYDAENNASVSLNAGDANASTLALSTTSLTASRYVATVNVTGQDVNGASRMATASQILSISQLEIPEISLSVVGGTRVNSDAKVVLTSAVSNYYPSNLTIAWTSSSNFEISSTTLRGPADLATLVIAPNALVGGPFVFTVTMTNIQGRSGSASIEVTLNSPPTLGTFSVSPGSGEELSTSFSLACTNFADEDTPLHYQFATYSAVSGNALVANLGVEQTLSTFTTYLAAAPDGSTNVTLRATIRDNLGATAYYFASVEVLTAAINATAQGIEADRLISQGDGASAAVVLSATIRSLNNESSRTDTSSEKVAAVNRIVALNSVLTTAGTAGAAETSATLLKAVTDRSVDGAETTDSTTREAVIDAAAEVISSSGFNIDAGSGIVEAFSNVLNQSTDAERQSRAAKLAAAVNEMAAGIAGDLAAGEDPITIVSEELEVAARVLAPPGTDGETSINGSAGARAVVPDNLGSELGISEDVLLMLVRYPEPLFPTNNDTAGGVVTLELNKKLSNGSYVLVGVSSASETIRIDIPGGSSHCMFWNSTIQNYSDAGVTYTGTSEEGASICETTHLTAFTTSTRFQASVNTFDQDDITLSALSFENPVMWLTTIVASLWIVLLLWGFRQDYLIAQTRAVDASAQYWRENNRFNARNFRTYGNWCRRMWWSTRSSHPWVAVYSHTTGDYLTTAKRVNVLFLLIFNMLTILLLLHNQEQSFPFLGSFLSNTMFTVAVCFPVPWFVFRLVLRDVPASYVVEIEREKSLAAKCSWCLPLVQILLGGEQDAHEYNAGGGRKATRDQLYYKGDHMGPQREGTWITSPKRKKVDAILEKKAGVKKRDNSFDFGRLVSIKPVAAHSASAQDVFELVGIDDDKVADSTLGVINEKSGDLVEGKTVKPKRRGNLENKQTGVPDDQTANQLLVVPSKIESRSECSTICCKIKPYNEFDVDTTYYTYGDLAFMIFAPVFIAGCWFVMVILAWKLGAEKMYTWTFESLAAFGEDIMLRFFNVLLLEAVFYFPFGALAAALCCMTVASSSSKDPLVDEEDEDTVREGIQFDTGYLGFRFKGNTVTSVEEGSQADVKGVVPGMQIFDMHAATALLPVNEKASKAFDEKEVEAIRKLVRARRRVAAIHEGTRHAAHKSTSTTLADIRAEEKKERERDGETLDEEDEVQHELEERRLFRKIQRVHRIENVFHIEFMMTRSRRASRHERELSGSTREIAIAVNEGVEFSLSDQKVARKSIELAGAKIIKTRSGHRGSDSIELTGAKIIKTQTGHRGSDNRGSLPDGVEMQRVHIRTKPSSADEGYVKTTKLPRRASPNEISDIETPREARHATSSLRSPLDATAGPGATGRELSVMLDDSVNESGGDALWGTSHIASRPKAQATPRVMQAQIGRAFQTTVIAEADSKTLQDEQQRAAPAPKRGRLDREMSVLLDSTRSSSGGSDFLWGTTHVGATLALATTGATSPNAQISKVKETKAGKPAKSADSSDVKSI